MQSPSPWRSRLPLAIVLASTFASFLLAPLYMTHLRQRFERQLPDEWSKITNNGPFTYVSPLIVSTRNHEEGVYAIKVLQIVRHGFPYDPHTGDRSVKSWLFDCLMFYPLAPFAWICGGDVQRGWILAHASLGTLWLLFFYALFRHYTGDPRQSLLFATASFFFIDSILWFFMNIVPAPLNISTINSTLFHWVARTTGEIQLLRLPSPGMTFLWLYTALGWIYFLGRSSRRNTMTSLVAGVAVGLLCLAHFYEWIFGVATLFLFLAATWRQAAFPTGHWNLRIAAVGALVTSGAYYLFAQHLTQDVMHDIITRMGTFRPVFQWGAITYLLYSIVLWRQSRKHRGETGSLWLFASVQALAAALLMNLHIALRYDIQFGHFSILGAIPTALLTLCWVTEHPRVKLLRPHAYILIAAIFAWVGLRGKAWSDTHYKLFGTPRDVEETAQWINKNVPQESLLLLLSGTLTEFLPLKIQMRYAVYNGSPAYGSPLPTDKNIDGIARILKTLRVDASRFIKERMERHWDWDQRKQTVTYLTRNLAWEEAQRGSWSYFLFNVSTAPGHDAERAKMILARIKETPAIKEPFYLWLHKGEESLLTRSPLSDGAILIYQNPSVKLYRYSLPQ